ncbi:hypothetical protein QA641_17450 [Bradyrhizobium sp. CB1650]|uniref:hypothetical protein n=1 Tax=Bradyrhizobium sp. CB1650 TaxID=3039153 RepID=UPI002435D5AD|nr:hypothetical protein [Bradyrhizobium sp. CB1650]WGD55509.1 hypothetical protein QA641_17450 [Bradyrhizobium sp. CB1650]
MSLLEQVLSASGGADRWRNLRGFTVHMTMSSLLVEQKNQESSLKEVVIEADIREHSVRIMGFDATNDRLFCDQRKVGIENEDGEAIRVESRSFDDWRRRASNGSWDVLDLAQFCGYSVWALVAMPYLLERAASIREEDPPPVNGGSRPLRLMQVEFSEEYSIYPLQQKLFFDAEGRLVRLDYDALELGGRPVSQFVSAYQDFSGYLVPTLRRLRPVGSESETTVPTTPPLLDIEIFDLSCRSG